MRLLPLLAALVLFALPGAALADSAPTLRDDTSVRAAGMAGATTGFAEDTDALHVNPAGIAATEHFNLAVGGFLDIPQAFYEFSAAAVDSKVNSDQSFPISGGLGYQYYVTGKGFDAHKGHVANLSLAAPIYSQYLFVGLTGRYLHEAGSVVSSAVTLDASLMAHIASLVGITFATYNIVDVHSLEAPRGFALGLAVGRTTKDSMFHVDIDGRLDQDPTGKYQPTVKVGAEYLIANIVVPRLGYAEDRFRDAHLICAGVGIHVEGWAIELAFQQAVKGSMTNVGVALRLLDI